MIRRILLLIMIGSVMLSGCRSEYRAQQYFEKLLIMIASGTPPDVAYMDSLRAPQFIANGWLYPIDEYIEQPEDFYPFLLEHFQRNGQTYVIPHDFQTVAMVINTELFDEAGLSRPDDSWTWDDMLNYADYIAKTNAGTDPPIFGIGLTTTVADWLPFVFQAGGQLLDETHTQMALYSQESIASLQYYLELAQSPRGYFPQPGIGPCSSPAWPYRGAACLAEMFVNGQLGMMLVDPALFNYVVYLYEQMGYSEPPIRVVRFPLHPSTGLRTSIAYVVGYGLTNQPTESSISFLRYATSQEAMRLWFDSDQGAPVEFIPARMSLAQEWKDAFSSNGSAAQQAAQVFVDSIDDVGWYQPATASSGTIAEFDQLAGDMVLQAMMNQMTAKEAVSQIQQIGEELLSQTQ